MKPSSIHASPPSFAVPEPQGNTLSSRGSRSDAASGSPDAYQLADADAAEVRSRVAGGWQGACVMPLMQVRMPDTQAIRALLEKRERLCRDVGAFFARWAGNPCASAAVPHGVWTSVSLADILASRPGVVIDGYAREADDRIAESTLIALMPTLAANGISVLFLDGLCSDLHQADIDAFCIDRTALVPNAGLHDNAVFQSRTALIRAARDHGIAVAAMDCAASSMRCETATVSVVGEIRKFFAAQRIASHPIVRSGGKWLAFGKAFDTAVPPGLSELTCTISLRILRDCPTGRLQTTDTGELETGYWRRTDLLLRADASLALEIAPYPGMTDLLKVRGQFILDAFRLQLHHFSRDDQVMTTPIVRVGQSFELQQSRWPLGRYASIEALRADLLQTVGLKPRILTSEALAKGIARPLGFLAPLSEGARGYRPGVTGSGSRSEMAATPRELGFGERPRD